VAGAVGQAECPLNDPALWQQDEALDLLFIALGNGAEDAARLECSAFRHPTRCGHLTRETRAKERFHEFLDR
jgi:hypothetical protein